MNKYIDNSKKLFGEDSVEVLVLSTGSQAGVPIGLGTKKYKPNKMRLQDLKIISLLLKNYKIYASANERIFHVEGENGYAYILKYLLVFFSFYILNKFLHTINGSLKRSCFHVF